MPTAITLEDVNKEKDFANVESVVDVTYDEAGNRLWYSVDNRVRNEKWTEVTLPGIGVFKSENADAASPTYNLFDRSCVIQATRWTNSPFYNNPGVFSRYMTGQSHYYHSTSLQRYVW